MEEKRPQLLGAREGAMRNSVDDFLDVSGGFLGIWSGSGPCGFWMFRGSLLDFP